MKSLLPLVLTALVVGVAAFFAGRLLATPPLTPEGETSESSSKEESAEALGADPTLRAPGSDASDLTVAEAESLRREVRRLSGEVARLEKEEAARAVVREATTETPDEAGPSMRFEYPGLPDAISDLSFAEAGRALQAMAPLIAEFVESVQSGSPRVELMGAVQRHNGLLIEQAGKAQKMGLSGTSINGAFTHPALIVNNVYAALAASKFPLSEAQEESLRELGDRFVQDEAKRVAGFTEETLGIEKLVSELELKHRLYAAIDELATEEQRNVLHPEAVRGRTQADVFSAGLVLAGNMAPLNYADESTLVQSLVGLAMTQLALGEEYAEPLRAHAEAWAARFDSTYLAYKPDGLDRMNMIPFERVLVAARAIVPFYRSVLRDVQMPDSVRKGLAGSTIVPVPMRAP